VDSRKFHKLLWKSFVEYYYGKEAGFEYVRGIRKNIQNDKPIIGHYNVNNEGSSDMYYKGLICCILYIKL
jgi:hypothetical protein